MQDTQYTSVSVFVSDTNEKYVETNEHPMSESLFDQLSSVIGFNDMNGKTYEEYVQKWKMRKEMSKSS
jgi:hypothetical protein